MLMGAPVKSIKRQSLDLSSTVSPWLRVNTRKEWCSSKFKDENMRLIYFIVWIIFLFKNRFFQKLHQVCILNCLSSFSLCLSLSLCLLDRHHSCTALRFAARLPWWQAAVHKLGDARGELCREAGNLVHSLSLTLWMALPQFLCRAQEPHKQEGAVFFIFPPFQPEINKTVEVCEQPTQALVRKMKRGKKSKQKYGTVTLRKHWDPMNFNIGWIICRNQTSYIVLRQWFTVTWTHVLHFLKSDTGFPLVSDVWTPVWMHTLTFRTHEWKGSHTHILPVITLPSWHSIQDPEEEENRCSEQRQERRKQRNPCCDSFVSCIDLNSHVRRKLT